MRADTGAYRRATDESGSNAGQAAFPLEITAVWLLFGIVAIEILVTYSRLPADDLYHVSTTGPAGGFGRVVVFANWPTALVALPILGLLLRQLSSGAARATALAGIALCAAVFWPGVVKESDLDARGINTVAALGVLVALALSLVALRSLGRPRDLLRQPGDALRLLIAAVVIAASLPWIAADLGLFFNGTPLGSIYQTGELRAQPGVVGLHAAVHHGHHHGMDGALLMLGALLLSRCLQTTSRRLRGLLGAYLAMLFSYGAGNVANDFWIEQVVKRGWTSWELPNVTTPKLSIAWGVIVLAAATIWVLAARRARSSVSRPAPRSGEPLAEP